MELDRAHPYAGGELAVAARFSKLMWSAGILLVLPLLPFYPPTALYGDAGWVVPAAGLAGLVGGVAALWRATLTWRLILVTAYAALALIFVLQVSAGEHAPYSRIVLMLVCGAALCHPRQYALPFAIVAAMTGVVVAYSATDATDALVTSGLEGASWILIALVLTSVMQGMRLQRLLLREERGIDSLTGLPNRRSFDEDLERYARRRRAGSDPLALIVMDVNGFKRLNDRHGHPAGDRALEEIARVLAHGVRPGDSCYRWGGDEFAVLLPDSGAEGAALVADRLALLVAGARVDPEPLTIGTGYAELGEGMDGAALVAAADAMLIDSKRKLRGLAGLVSAST